MGQTSSQQARESEPGEGLSRNAEPDSGTPHPAQASRASRTQNASQLVRQQKGSARQTVSQHSASLVPKTCS